MSFPNDESTKTYGRAKPRPRGTGPNSAGQSGDTQGLPEDETAGPQSVEELVEEGQGLEANIIAGVEDAEDDIGGPIKTKEVPEEDVPFEYDNQERDETR